MKKIFLTTMFIVSMLLCANGIHAQIEQTELNQVELHKQYLGTWKSEYKDTTVVFVFTPYGKGSLQSNCEVSTKNKTIFQCRQVWAYDQNCNKMLGIQFEKNTSNITTYLCWFISKKENETVQIIIRDPEHIEKAKEQWTEVFKSRDLFIQSHMINNKTVSVRTFMRVR
ncbi:hypothetical protein [uncultured Bacteroides sp.]|uniref:hypothetical protein n=1 Tax=uncultured Bacteroides sp. TaxID=162156 RepID=UPI002AAA9D2C|nr:hypothetical protein [uncultured Bacteroides sp.]